MTIYNTLEDGALSSLEISYIPVNHRFYFQALEEVENGDSEIIPYAHNLDDAKEKAVDSIITLTANARAEITGNVDQYKLSGWAVKTEVARRVLDKTATDSEISIIQIEAENREKDETVENLATKIIVKSDQLQMTNGIVESMEKKAIKSVKAAKKESKIKAIVDELEESLKLQKFENH